MPALVLASNESRPDRHAPDLCRSGGPPLGEQARGQVVSLVPRARPGTKLPVKPAARRTLLRLSQAAQNGRETVLKCRVDFPSESKRAIEVHRHESRR